VAQTFTDGHDRALPAGHDHRLTGAGGVGLDSGTCTRARGASPLGLLWRFKRAACGSTTTSRSFSEMPPRWSGRLPVSGKDMSDTRFGGVTQTSKHVMSRTSTGGRRPRIGQPNDCSPSVTDDIVPYRSKKPRDYCERFIRKTFGTAPSSELGCHHSRAVKLRERVGRRRAVDWSSDGGGASCLPGRRGCSPRAAVTFGTSTREHRRCGEIRQAVAVPSRRGQGTKSFRTLVEKMDSRTQVDRTGSGGRLHRRQCRHGPRS